MASRNALEEQDQVVILCIVIPTLSTQPKEEVKSHRIEDNITVVILSARFVDCFGHVKARDKTAEEFPYNDIAVA